MGGITVEYLLNDDLGGYLESEEGQKKLHEILSSNEKPEVEEVQPGLWRAKLRGCTGTGETREEAIRALCDKLVKSDD
jgi:hypothetical protein